MTAALRAMEVKLTEAKAPSRELDEDIALLLLGAERCKETLPAGGVCNEVHTSTPLTSSLDAAVAFAEAMLPGWPWQVQRSFDRDGDAVHNARVRPDWSGDDEDMPSRFWATHGSSAALALCLAVIRALLAKETG